MKKITIAAAALALLATGPVQAQSSHGAAARAPTGRGLMVGVHGMLATGVTVRGPDIEGRFGTKPGVGASLQVGYGVTSRLMPFASLDGAIQRATYDASESFAVARWELGARYALASPGRRFTPYVLAFLGGHAMGAESSEGGVDAELTLSGVELGAGGGVLYPLSPQFSLDAGVIAARGKFNELKLTGDIETEDSIDVDPSTSLRLKLGVNWYPSGRAPAVARGSGR